jgi:hypothetical protein
MTHSIIQASCLDQRSLGHDWKGVFHGTCCHCGRLAEVDSCVARGVTPCILGPLSPERLEWYVFLDI